MGSVERGSDLKLRKLLSRGTSPNISRLLKAEGNVCRASVESVGQAFTQLMQTNKNLIFVLASLINVISWCHQNISSVILQLFGSRASNSNNGSLGCPEERSLLAFSVQSSAAAQSDFAFYWLQPTNQHRLCQYSAAWWPSLCG